MKEFIINDQTFSLNEIQQVLESDLKLALGPLALEKIARSYAFLHEQIKKKDQAVYGINTGFGSLHRMRIPSSKMQKLQENLVRSHACGVGERLPEKTVKLMLLLKIITLSKGYSGVQLSTVRRLIDFYNYDVLPVVYEQGSLGASGDLAPLAHFSLPLIGEGEVIYEGRIYPSVKILKQFGWEPIKLQAKEGLALLNGTQFMSALGMENLWEAEKLDLLADWIGAVSLEAYDGRIEPFSEVIQKIRPYKGQIKTAERVRNILKGSEIIFSSKEHVQDPYSFRCMPQVHGSVKHVLSMVREIFTVELNAVTDNPIIDAENEQILSGGNFHGEPLAMASDMLAVALSELANISERRTYRMISGKRDLPAYLTPEPGINSGLMIPQYMAASLVNQNKQLATPNSVDSIESSNGQEDHVSMGANSVLKTRKIIQNTQYVLAVELLAASQALFFRKKSSSENVKRFLSRFREEISFMEEDEILYEKIHRVVEIFKELSPEDLQIF